MVQLYKSLARPHLEYCEQAWRPQLKKDIKLLEKVQKRALKMIDEFKGMQYDDILRKVGLSTLETRRLHGNLIEVFKILKGFEDIDKSIFLKSSKIKLREHSEKLYHGRSRPDCSGYDLYQRKVGVWNSLDGEVVECKTVNSFKSTVDKWFRSHGYY